MSERIFITGGTGSLGSALVKHFVAIPGTVVVVYSRDPHKQNALLSEIPSHLQPNVRMTVGDVRDKDRLMQTMKGSTVVIHTAALKHVDVGEYNSSEYVKTNITGSENVARAGVDLGVRKMLFISTDKSVQAYNLYGRTKAVAEREWIRYNLFGRSVTALSAMRYGNIFDSRGSIMNDWSNKKRGDTVLVRTPTPTRFVCFLSYAIRWVDAVLNNMRGGEIFVPANLSSVNMLDLAETIVGREGVYREPLLSGEKQHEVLLAPEELSNTVLKCLLPYNEEFFIINPDNPQWETSAWSGEDLPQAVRESCYSSGAFVGSATTFLDLYRSYREEK